MFGFTTLSISLTGDHDAAPQLNHLHHSSTAMYPNKERLFQNDNAHRHLTQGVQN